MLILGYAGYNLTLRKQNIIINRTCREATVKEKGIQYLEELFFKNLIDLFKTIQWTAKNKIKFYRIASDIAPHCTNPNLIDEKYRNDYTKLVYPLEQFEKYFKKIGNLAKKNNIRLTFHPDLFNVLNSKDENIIIKTFRDLHLHATILNLMGLNTNSVVILHGGGIYGDKKSSMKRWVINFNKLPLYIKERIVLENDETGFSVEDCLIMSKSVDSFLINPPDNKTKLIEKVLSKIPIVFDIFHYYCYNQTIIKKESNEIQKGIKDLLPIVKETWDQSHRIMKMHISEHLIGGSFRAHSDFVNIIPDELLNFVKEDDKTIYLMIEAKFKELALIRLRKKYYYITE